MVCHGGRAYPGSTVPCFAMQVVDCRRILKWTYAYGYYRFGDQVQEENAKEQQQSFFEFNQVSFTHGYIAPPPPPGAFPPPPPPGPALPFLII